MFGGCLEKSLIFKNSWKVLEFLIKALKNPWIWDRGNLKHQGIHQGINKEYHLVGCNFECELARADLCKFVIACMTRWASQCCSCLGLQLWFKSPNTFSNLSSYKESPDKILTPTAKYYCIKNLFNTVFRARTRPG